MCWESIAAFYFFSIKFTVLTCVSIWKNCSNTFESNRFNRLKQLFQYVFFLEQTEYHFYIQKHSHFFIGAVLWNSMKTSDHWIFFRSNIFLWILSFYYYVSIIFWACRGYVLHIQYRVHADVDNNLFLATKKIRSSSGWIRWNCGKK